MQYDLYSKSVKAVQFKGGGAAIRLNGVGGGGGGGGGRHLGLSCTSTISPLN